MQSDPSRHNVVVIGGGFYGAAIAVYLARERGITDILLVEMGASLLSRASYNNQARVHNGYHYSRSFTTAYRSRINLPKFVRDWPQAVKTDFTKLYAIARRNSKVTGKQFERVCREIGARIEPADSACRRLFNPQLIEDVFAVEEYAFDATQLAEWARTELAEHRVQVRLHSRVSEIQRAEDGALRVVVQGASGEKEVISCSYIFNSTYSGLNQIRGDFPGVKTGLKQEITEMALMKVPLPLDNIGITVMDGPFFSLMPFPARGLHTLSHVRYTPHRHWKDEAAVDPYEKLGEYHRETRVERMVRDVERYLPAIRDTQYVESLFEVKTVLVKNEGDDGRPILFEKYPALPGCYSVLGGKIDNIYDVLEKLDGELFPLVAQPVSNGRAADEN
jgi:glycine/D-amino acid oxidase-like deaminating enzyme